MLPIHIFGGVHGAGVHQLPGKGYTLAFKNIQVERLATSGNRNDMPLRFNNFDYGVPVSFQIDKIKYVVHLQMTNFLQFRRNVLVVVNHVIGPHFHAPVYAVSCREAVAITVRLASFLAS